MIETMVRKAYMMPQKKHELAARVCKENGDTISYVIRRSLAEYADGKPFEIASHERIPADRMKTVSYRIRSADYDQALQVANARNEQISAVIRAGIDEYLKEKGHGK